MDGAVDWLDDISKINIIYTVILVSAANDIAELVWFKWNPLELVQKILLMMSFNTSMITFILPDEDDGGGDARTASSDHYGRSTNLDGQSSPTETDKPNLMFRLAKRLEIYSNNAIQYIQNQLDEHTATSIASFSVLIIVLSIICCFIISLMREEERRIKEQYKKLNAGSSSSFLAAQDGSTSASTTSTSAGASSVSNQAYHGHPGGGYHKIGAQSSHSALGGGAHFIASPTSPLPFATSPSHHINNSTANPNHHKLRLIELRRETYFGLVRLLKPGCRTIVLLCDTQSRINLLTKFYQSVYPYRKNKTLQFAFLLIEKNIGWYRELLKLALGEKRDLHINPINCIGTVLVLNGFKKYFSIYHASDSRFDSDVPSVLLEESLLDHLSEWLERLFAGRVNRYYVSYWPDRMR